MRQLKKILLVDDDQTNNFLNKKLLKDLNIAKEIKILTNGKLGFDYLLENCDRGNNSCPGLIILDHHMPVMDGLELMKSLHKTGILERIEAVFLLLAIQTKPEEKEIFQELGVQEFTAKPLSKKTVMDAYVKYWARNTE